ncbi:hypothetical protein KPH14_009246 [Odynerus spinipes]|uniref:Sulfakinin n=1 Tax=Odynerus spinipes TaxID=1348599 RepID=A0AAD9RP85_9HYME|nr:hypothetical protein KPH14_009246 [Odynerus spinipes]
MWLFHGKCTAAPEFIGSVHRQQNKNRAFLRGYAIDDTYGGDDDILDLNKRQQFDDYGHMRFGKRDRFDDYGHM